MLRETFRDLIFDLITDHFWLTDTQEEISQK